jgi:hypothetical protein
MHDAAVERAMLQACVMAGGVEGITSRQILAVDGTNEHTQIAIVSLLAEIVGKALSQLKVDY